MEGQDGRPRSSSRSLNGRTTSNPNNNNNSSDIGDEIETNNRSTLRAPDVNSTNPLPGAGIAAGNSQLVNIDDAGNSHWNNVDNAWSSVLGNFVEIYDDFYSGGNVVYVEQLRQADGDVNSANPVLGAGIDAGNSQLDNVDHAGNSQSDNVDHGRNSHWNNVDYAWSPVLGNFVEIYDGYYSGGNFGYVGQLRRADGDVNSANPVVGAGIDAGNSQSDNVDDAGNSQSDNVDDARNSQWNNVDYAWSPVLGNFVEIYDDFYSGGNFVSVGQLRRADGESCISVQQLCQIKILEQHLSDRNNITYGCPICHDDFELGEEALQLRCDHIFHQRCISPWVEFNETCPACRSNLRALS